MDWTEVSTELDKPLDAKNVKTRSQSGRTLSYVEGWHAIAEANRIFGHGSWNRETIGLTQIGEPYNNDRGNVVINYIAKVRVTVAGGVIREGTGFGSGIDRDLGRAHESAVKEAETDAMKRALMTFGHPFGLALYDKTQEHVTNGEAPPPASPNIVPNAAERAMNKLIIELNGAQDAADFETIKSAPAFKETYAKLPNSMKKQVAEHGAKIAAKFQEAA